MIVSEWVNDGRQRIVALSERKCSYIYAELGNECLVARMDTIMSDEKEKRWQRLATGLVYIERTYLDVIPHFDVASQPNGEA